MRWHWCAQLVARRQSRALIAIGTSLVLVSLASQMTVKTLDVLCICSILHTLEKLLTLIYGVSILHLLKVEYLQHFRSCFCVCLIDDSLETKYDGYEIARFL